MRAEKISSGRPRRAARNAFITAAVILLGTLLLLWPTIVNRQPFFISDTTSYVRGADAAVFKLFGISTDWTERFLDRYHTDGESPAAAATQPSAQKQSGDGERPVTLAGRSVYYGAFLYAADRVAGLRLAAALQALFASLCLYLTVKRFRRLEGGSAIPFLLLTVLLSVASSLPYFAGYLTPDLYSGLGILAAAHLVCRAPPLTVPQKAFWVAVLCWATLTHSSNLLILLVVAGALLVGRMKWRAAKLRSIGLIGCAIAVGITGDMVFYGAVRALSGDAPVRPPFLMARLIADGPGLDYLQRTCPQNGFAMCRHMKGLSRYSDAILWSDNPNEGVFSAVGYDERRQIGGEERRFVLAVVADQPLQVMRSSAASVLEQAGKWCLGEFNNAPVQNANLIGKLPPRVAREFAGSLAYRDAMPVHGAEYLSLATTLAGLAVLLWTLLRPRSDEDVRLFLAVLLLGIAADIAVCGAISTPHDRYSMRVLWLIPMGAFIAVWLQGRAWRRNAAASHATRSAAQKASTG